MTSRLGASRARDLAGRKRSLRERGGGAVRPLRTPKPVGARLLGSRMVVVRATGSPGRPNAMRGGRIGELGGHENGNGANSNAYTSGDTESAGDSPPGCGLLVTTARPSSPPVGVCGGSSAGRARADRGGSIPRLDPPSAWSTLLPTRRAPRREAPWCCPPIGRGVSCRAIGAATEPKASGGHYFRSTSRFRRPAPRGTAGGGGPQLKIGSPPERARGNAFLFTGFPPRNAGVSHGFPEAPCPAEA